MIIPLNKRSTLARRDDGLLNCVWTGCGEHSTRLQDIVCRHPSQGARAVDGVMLRAEVLRVDPVG